MTEGYAGSIRYGWSANVRGQVPGGGRFLRGVVLADAGPLYALRDLNDALHERSHEDLGRLKAKRLETLVSYSTLLEDHAQKRGILGGAVFHNRSTSSAVRP